MRYDSAVVRPEDDSNLGVDTEEGKCRPSADNCTFLYLRPEKTHDQAMFTDENGDSYRLRLLEIHRVSVSSANGGGNSGSGSNGQSGSGNRSPAFTGSADSNNKDSASQPSDSPPGEPDQPFTFRGFFRDEG